MTETQKLLKRFALTCIMLLCVTAMLCGGAVVNRNTGRLALGETGRQVGFSFDPETITIVTGRQAVEWPALSPALQWLRLAPAPVGTFFMISDTVANNFFTPS